AGDLFRPRPRGVREARRRRRASDAVGRGGPDRRGRGAASRGRHGRATAAMNVLAFDIETVPDVELGRRLYNVADLDDESVAKIMSFKQKQARGTDFLPLAQQRIVAVSVVLRNRDALHIYSLGDEHSPERELVQRFFDGIERFRPELVSWNGCGFDLPVLN